MLVPHNCDIDDLSKLLEVPFNLGFCTINLVFALTSGGVENATYEELDELCVTGRLDLIKRVVRIEASVLLLLAGGKLGLYTHASLGHFHEI